MDTGFRFINGADKIFPTSNEDIQGRGWHAPPFVDKPTFESDDIAGGLSFAGFNFATFEDIENILDYNLNFEEENQHG